jgi:hypothetical protein
LNSLNLSFSTLCWILTLRILAAPAVAKDIFSHKDDGFLDESFGNDMEIVRESGLGPAFERANRGDFSGSQQQRHTGAGRADFERAAQ